jgi:benzoylformate decarboxylase
VLLIVLANGSYAIMDALARDAGGSGAWPGFGEVSLATLAEGFGCPARRVSTHDELIAALDELLPGLAEREAPLLLEVAVAP